MSDEVRTLRGLLWYAWREFNSIRARDGAPEGVCPKYWDDITTLMCDTLGEDDAKPWPSVDAREICIRLAGKIR